MNKTITKPIKFSQCNCVVVPGEFKTDNIPSDCPATWRLISRGHTVGVFQLENKLGQDWSSKVKPKNIHELSALNALLRPGALESGMSDDYVAIKFGKKQPLYLHNSLKDILEPTYGCMIYQEQAIKIAIDIAGFTPESADLLRKAIGKKLPVLMAKLKSRFIEGCKKVGFVNKVDAEKIFGWIEKSQRYSFNKCVSGSTIIRRPNGGRFVKSCQYSIEHMYRIRNDIEYAKEHGHSVLRRKWKRLGHYGKGLSLCQDGRIRPNTIRDIQPAGKQQLYKLTLENGKNIYTTGNHKFPTPLGEKTLKELNAGEHLYVCGIYEQLNLNGICKFSNKSKKHKKRKYQHPHCGFPIGEANPAYTNGSFTLFKKYKKSIPDVCENCGAKNCRIEVAHLNGDRNNSCSENLNKLCVSCHKKHDYAAGRVKRGEKGYPSECLKIKSIILYKVCETWNITMDGPNHNFVTGDNIITCNSHAQSYAELSFTTAWLKCHFPQEFFTSYLAYSGYKQNPKEEICRLVQDARLFGVGILLPDIKRKNVDFTMDKENNSIFFGLSHIKSVGKSAIKTIIEMSDGDLDTWRQFLAAVPALHRDVALSLIKSGACDGYKLPRTRMVDELNIVLGYSTRNEDGKKIEIRGLTQKEREWFFKKLKENFSPIDILQQMSVENRNIMFFKKMKKDELINFITNNYKDLYTMEYLSKSKKSELLDIISSREKLDKAESMPRILVKRRDILKEKSVFLSKNKDNEDSFKTRAMAEKLFLGISLSCSAVDDCEIEEKTMTCLEAMKLPDKGKFDICGIIESVKHTKTKRGRNPGQPMCFVNFSDSTYAIDRAVMFPGPYAFFNDLCKENHICIFRGTKKNGSFIIEEIKKVI